MNGRITLPNVQYITQRDAGEEGGAEERESDQTQHPPTGWC